MRQSAAVWFQRASRTSAQASSISAVENRALVDNETSETAIAGIVMGGLAEARHRPLNPIRGPFDELHQRHARIAEQPRCLGAVDQPGFGRFHAGECRGLAEMPPEAVREP